MNEVLTCGCGCQSWGYDGRFTCRQCGFVFWDFGIHDMNKRVKEEYIKGKEE